MAAPAVTPGPASAAEYVSSNAEDALRRLAAPLSSSGLWARWLREGRLLERLTAAVGMVARDESPRPVLGFLKPPGSFAARDASGELVASPATYSRYDGFTHTVTSLDPAKIGTVYSELAPAFQGVFSTISRPGRSFTVVLHRAIHVLCDTPVPASSPALVQSGHTFYYADPKLEELGDAKKLLLRMGPTNERAIQTWLSALDRSLPG